MSPGDAPLGRFLLGPDDSNPRWPGATRAGSSQRQTGGGRQAAMARADACCRAALPLTPQDGVVAGFEMSVSSRLRQWARDLKRQTLVVWFAARDPRTPVYLRLLALVIAAYALSPIDLIPDFIPVLGYLDDLIIVPLGLLLILRLLPAEVRADATRQAAAVAERPTSRLMAALIIATWVLGLLLLLWWASQWLNNGLNN